MHIEQCLPTRLGSVILHSPPSGFDIYDITLQKHFSAVLFQKEIMQIRAPQAPPEKKVGGQSPPGPPGSATYGHNIFVF